MGTMLTPRLQRLPVRTGPPLLEIHALVQCLPQIARQCGKGSASAGIDPNGRQLGTFQISFDP